MRRRRCEGEGILAGAVVGYLFIQVALPVALFAFLMLLGYCSAPNG